MEPNAAPRRPGGFGAGVGAAVPYNTILTTDADPPTQRDLDLGIVTARAGRAGVAFQARRRKKPRKGGSMRLWLFVLLTIGAVAVSMGCAPSEAEIRDMVR